MKFTVVSVPDSNLHLHNACQKCSVLQLYTIYETLRGGQKETSKGGEIKRKLTCNMERMYVEITMKFSKGIISRHWQLLILYSLGGRLMSKYGALV